MRRNFALSKHVCLGFMGGLGRFVGKRFTFAKKFEPMEDNYKNNMAIFLEAIMSTLTTMDKVTFSSIRQVKYWGEAS